MEKWYVLSTISGKEQEALELLKQAVSPALWKECKIPKKTKVFRSGGILHLIEEVMFPGYLFIKTDAPALLEDNLQKARKFPQFIGSAKEMITPVEDKDLHFLKAVCGDDLGQVMGVTKIVLDNENKMIGADGVLEQYQSQIVKLNLHKRYALVEVELFNRKQTILFGVRLERDQAG